MAAPTSVITTEPNYVIDVSGTNVSAGNNDYTLRYNQVNLAKGFSVATGTLTNMTVTVLGSNKDGVTADITNDLFGVASLSSDTMYGANVNINVNSVIIRAARTNATNAVAFTIFAPKK